MSVFLVALIIFTGLVLLILEIFVIPGFGVAGIGGIVLLGLGIYFTYQNFGSTIGHLTIAGTVVLFGLLIYISTRTNTWKRMALHTSIDSTIETVEEGRIQVGDVGLSVSRLNPMGKARINDEIIEARCPGHFVDENSPVEVVKVFKTHVIVKPKLT
jgi:membrane-bound ClpP family serine protease